MVGPDRAPDRDGGGGWSPAGTGQVGSGKKILHDKENRKFTVKMAMTAGGGRKAKRATRAGYQRTPGRSLCSGQRVRLLIPTRFCPFHDFLGSRCHPAESRNIERWNGLEQDVLPVGEQGQFRPWPEAEAFAHFARDHQLALRG